MTGSRTQVPANAMSEESKLAGPRSFHFLALSLPEQIAERIAEAILEDHYTPGTRLKEVELAKSFGVSRAPVREALRILETQKLVRITPQKGALVVSLSVEDLDELFLIRAALMGLSVRKIAERGLEQDYKLLKSRLNAVEALAKQGDMTRALRRLGELSEFAAELAGPGWIRDFLVIAIHQTVKFSRRGLSNPAATLQVVEGWKRLLVSIHERRAADAELEARGLMLSVWKGARVALEQHR